MPNHLREATSPYLLQHADNPVDWWEWCDEAFAEAKRRDVPVLLSIGYAACHWCHVMAHESFEDAETAALMNTHFVNIKVDREERPDVDAVYMDATQAMTGQGGWPMTVVLTPDRVPFSAGTYYPKVPRHGLPSFTQLLRAVDQAWRERRGEIEQAGQRIVAALTQTQHSVGAQSSDPGEMAVNVLEQQRDRRHGGFGGAPKFPPAMVAEFLLRRDARTGDPRCLDMAGQTYEAMARGGIYDQLGGGFARYSVDQSWAVPHFEKMLYDNALLLRGYLHWWRQTDEPLAARVAHETADFLIAELRTAEGGFAASLDADSDGHEGTFYVWTRDQLRDVLGDDADRAADLFHVTQHGTFERGASTLQLHEDPADERERDDLRRRLLAARAERTRPARDDKVVTAWNGLTIAALAEAGVLLQRPDLVDAARDAARLLVDVHLVDGRLRRASRDGRAGAPAGVLEDYACLAEGLLTVYGVTGALEWFATAQHLVTTMLARFDDGDGGFFDTADDAETLYKRPADPTDNATPSGQAMAATVLTSMAALTGDTALADRARGMVERLGGLAERSPRFAGQTLATGEAQASGPTQVAVVGPDADHLVRAALLRADPGLVVARSSTAVDDDHPVTLLHGRVAVDGRATAYVCHDFTCDLPTDDPARVTG